MRFDATSTRWRTESRIGRRYGKSAGRLAAPATILKRLLKGTGRPAIGCIFRDDSLQVLAKLLSQRLGLLWENEDPQLVLVKIVGHPLP
jgi:hypothetical protein